MIIKTLRWLVKKLFLLFFIFLEVRSEQFVYPLFEVEPDSIMLTYQKSLDDVELWLCRKDSGVATKELSSMFTPSQVQMLPDGSGFSFIDRGRIRIKPFARRAPRVVDILDPISMVLSMKWIDEESFVFVGKCFNRYGVFLCNLRKNGVVETMVLALSDKEHYLYPSIVNGQLFCVAQGDLDVYHIVQIPWEPKSFEEFEPKEFEPLLLATFSDPTCFLSMKSDSEGFFAQYSHGVHDEYLIFRYFSISIVKGGCEIQELFDFRLPLPFLIGSSEQRIYDSIYPFLPRFNKFDETIVFVDFDPEIKLSSLYKYCLKSRSTVKISHTKGLFAPLPSEDKALYAGRMYKSGDCEVIQELKKRGLADSVMIED